MLNDSALNSQYVKTFDVSTLQWSGDRHGGQLDFHRPATILGRRHGLGHDCFGYSSHWIW